MDTPLDTAFGALQVQQHFKQEHLDLPTLLEQSAPVFEATLPCPAGGFLPVLTPVDTSWMAGIPAVPASLVPSR
jgi:hypothetical protein